MKEQNEAMSFALLHSDDRQMTRYTYTHIRFNEIDHKVNDQEQQREKVKHPPNRSSRLRDCQFHRNKRENDVKIHRYFQFGAVILRENNIIEI